MRITFLRKVTSAARLQMAGKPTDTIYRALLEFPEKSEAPGVSKVKLVTTAASTNSSPGARRSGSTGTLNASCRLASLKQESLTRSGAIDSRKRSNLRRSSNLSGRSMSVATALWRITCGCYIHAAYSWGMKSDNDYRNTSPRGFRIHTILPRQFRPNPRSRARAGSTRKSSCSFIAGWNPPDTPVHPSYPRALQLIMLTGQRVEEIARLHVDQWDAREKIVDWSKTKNLQPHAVPVPSIAAD